MKDLKYEKFEIKEYLKVGDKWSASAAFKFRTRMAEVGQNFHGKYGNDPVCPMKDCLMKDSQKHLGECAILKHEANLKDIQYKYEELFSEEPNKVLKVSKHLDMILKKREALLDKN